jgi:hypothetical protein
MWSARARRRSATSEGLLARRGDRSRARPGALWRASGVASFALAASLLAPAPALGRPGPVAEPGLALSALWEFSLSLAFACVWLVAGRWLDFDLSHLGLPVLVWALEATLGTAARLRDGVPHPLDLAEYALEGLFALALLIGLMSLALGAARRRHLTLGALARLAGAGIAVLTLLLDWCFVLLLSPTLRK